MIGYTAVEAAAAACSTASLITAPCMPCRPYLLVDVHAVCQHLLGSVLVAPLGSVVDGLDRLRKRHAVQSTPSMNEVQCNQFNE